MMIKHRGFAPVVERSAFVAPTSVLVGHVRVNGRARIMYGAVLDSEGSSIEVGECTIICETAVLRATGTGDVEHPVTVGDHVFISPHATLLGCAVEHCSYIATGATILHGAVVHSGAVIAVGALVHARTVVPKEFFVPPNTIAIGDPMKIYSPGDSSVPDAIRSIAFARTAFGVKADWEDRISRYTQTTEVRSKEFESHFVDVVLDTRRQKPKSKPHSTRRQSS